MLFDMHSAYLYGRYRNDFFVDTYMYVHDKIFIV